MVADWPGASTTRWSMGSEGPVGLLPHAAVATKHQVASYIQWIVNQRIRDWDERHNRRGWGGDHPRRLFNRPARGEEERGPAGT